MTLHGYELTGEWKNSTCGKIVTATKGGKKYFLKKYQTPVAPIDNGTLDAKTFANNQKKFDDFVAMRKKVNTSIRPIAGPGGNIVIPSEEFMDGNQYVEASEFVEGAIPKEEMLSLLPGLEFSTKLLLMKTAAGALSSVHSKHIIHSDLKIENLLLVRNPSGNYVAKMLDFDSSYPIDDKPEEIIGTIDYYSPELGTYVDSEDEAEEMKKFITEKTDIFSLGLIYHFYLAGAFPEAVSLTEKLQKRKDKGKVIYPWVVLNSGCELQISPKITSFKFISLISDMLNIDPNQRPTASEVLKRLQAPEPSAELVLQEPFPEHGIVYNKDKIKADNIASVEKTIEGSKNKYKLMYKTGKREVLTKEELIEKGYAKMAAPDGFEAPWEEHHIAFDLDKIKSRGFVSSKNVTKGGVKGYEFYRADASATFLKLDMLIAMKYAKKLASAESVSAPPVEVVEGFAEPWPEHKIEFIIDAIKAKGYVASAQKNMNGVNGYEFVRANGSRQFIRVEMVIIQKMAKKI